MEKQQQKIDQVRVRLAPSPTGVLHLGTARSALFNYLFAKKNKGKFILRIEDTDLERSKEEYEKDTIESLKWLGLNWDEGPFRQSERKHIYRSYIEKLLASGDAFWCFHSKEELKKEKEEQIKKGEPLRHICQHKGKSPSGQRGVIRFRLSDKKISFHDMIRGKLEFDCSLLGDFSIARDRETPLYNLGVVIDDIEMKISHVIRGEDHISNTPKQILLYYALKEKEPFFAHLPLILGSDKSKLSKRHGAVSVNRYKEEGYLPEALVNFMAFLGWHPGTEREVFSLPELIEEFSIERVHKGGAIFNLDRLNWLNGYYIRHLDPINLSKRCLPYLKRGKLIKKTAEKEYEVIKTGEKISLDLLRKIIGLEQERMKKLNEIEKLTKLFFVDKLNYDKKLLLWEDMKAREAKDNLEAVLEIISQISRFDKEALKEEIMPLAKERGTGRVLWPLRVALSGRPASPGPFEIMEVLGKKKSAKRIKQALKK